MKSEAAFAADMKADSLKRAMLHLMKIILHLMKAKNITKLCNLSC